MATALARKKKKKQRNVRGRSPGETITATMQLHEVKSQYNTSNKRFGSITNQTMNLSSKLLNINAKTNIAL